MSVPEVDNSNLMGMQKALSKPKIELIYSPIEKLAIQKLQGKEEGTFEVFFNTRTRHWQVSYVHDSEILTKDLDAEQVEHLRQNHQDILAIVKKSLGLKKGELLSLEQQKEVATTKPIPYERIPMVDGICIFNDMSYTEKPVGEAILANTAVNRAFTAEFAQACKQNLPIVVSPHLIRNALMGADYGVSLADLKKSYIMYSDPNQSFIVLIPKKQENLSLKSLSFSDQLKPIPEIDVKDAITGQIFAKAKRPQYADLKAIFTSSQSKTPTRLAFFIGGHGDAGSVIGLTDSEYRDFVEHLNRVYSLSGCVIASCDPHGIQPKINGVLIQLGTPHLVTSMKEGTQYKELLENLNSIEETSLFLTAQQQINKALECIPKIDMRSQPTIWFDFFTHTGRPRTTPTAVNLTFMKMQEMHLLQRKGVEDKTVLIPKEKTELRLFVPDVTAVNLTFEEEAIPIFSYVKEKSYHVFDTVTLNHSSVVTDLEGFVRKSLQHAFIQNYQMVSSTNNLFLFKKIIINNITYENVCVLLEKDKPADIAFMRRDPPLPNGEKSALQEDSSDKFLSMILKGIQLARPSDQAIHEASGGHQTHSSVMKSIQSQFFPDKKWVAYLDSPRLLHQFLSKEKELDDFSFLTIYDYVLDHNYQFEYPEFIALLIRFRPGLAKSIYTNQEQFAADLKNALLPDEPGKRALRRIKFGLSDPKGKEKRNPERKFVITRLESDSSLDLAIQKNQLELVRVLLYHGAYSLKQDYPMIDLLEQRTAIYKLLLEKQLERKGKLASEDLELGDTMSQLMMRLLIEKDLDKSVFESYIKKALKEKKTLSKEILVSLLKRDSSDLLLQVGHLIPKRPDVAVTAQSQEERAAIESLAYRHAMKPGCSDALVILMNKGWVDPKKVLAKAYSVGDCQMIIDVMRSGMITEKDWFKLPPPLTVTTTEWQTQVVERFRRLALEKDHSELFKALDQSGQGYLDYRKTGKTEQEFIKQEMRNALKNGCTEIFTYLLKERLVFINPDISITEVLDMAGGLEKMGPFLLQRIITSNLPCKDLGALVKISNHILRNPDYSLPFKNIFSDYLITNLDKLNLTARQMEELFSSNQWLSEILNFDLKKLYQFYFDRVEHNRLLECDVSEFLKIFVNYLSQSKDLPELGPLMQKKFLQILKEREMKTDDLLNAFFALESYKDRVLIPHILHYCVQKDKQDILQLFEATVREMNNEIGQDNIKKYQGSNWEIFEETYGDPEITKTIKRLEFMYEMIHTCKKRLIRPSNELLDQAQLLANMVIESEERQKAIRVIGELRELPEDIVLPEILPEGTEGLS